MTELEKLKAGLEYYFYNSVVGGVPAKVIKKIEQKIAISLRLLQAGDELLFFCKKKLKKGYIYDIIYSVK